MPDTFQHSAKHIAYFNCGMLNAHEVKPLPESARVGVYTESSRS